MQHKRDNQVYVRIPDDLKRELKRHAAKHLRSLNQDILFLIDLGLHVQKHTPGAWSQDAATDDENG